MKKDIMDKKINYILKKLIELRHVSLQVDDKNITKLYGKYLKLLVQMENIAPLKELLHGNCYFYALGLPIPSEFRYKYSALTTFDFQVNVGDISNYQSLFTALNPVTTMYYYQNLLDALKSDLDFLKIKQYASDINDTPKHEGFKIAIFSDNDRKRGDYHFARQTKNGVWLQKFGYYNGIIKTDNILDYMDDYNKKQDTNYEYVKTLELVKPVIYRK